MGTIVGDLIGSHHDTPKLWAYLGGGKVMGQAHKSPTCEPMQVGA
jgi:hypothetical protein